MKNIFLMSSVLLLMFSCSKLSTSDNLLKKQSLSEFAESENDKTFFEENKTIDNNSKTNLDNSHNGNVKSYKNKKKIKVIFRWDGCHKPLGICFVLVGKTGHSGSDDGTDTELKLLSNNKLLIKAENTDNGISSDGFFPVHNDFIIKDVFDNDVTIKKGIYKAKYNESLERYESVIVDLL